MSLSGDPRDSKPRSSLAFVVSLLAAVGFGYLSERRNRRHRYVEILRRIYRRPHRMFGRSSTPRVPDPERGAHLARIGAFTAAAAIPSAVGDQVVQPFPPPWVGDSPRTPRDDPQAASSTASRGRASNRVAGAERAGIDRFLYRGILLTLGYLFMLDGFVRLETNSSSATLLRDVLPWSLALIGVLFVLVRPSLPRLKKPLFGLVILFVAITIIELSNPDTISVRNGLQALRPHLEFVPLFFLGYAVMRTEGRLRGLAVVLVLAAAANGVVGLVQSGLTPAQLGTWGPGYHLLVAGGVVNGQAHNPAVYYTAAGAKLRPPALGADVGFGGVLGDLALPFALALVFGSKRRWDRLLGLVCLPLIVGAIITSQTRSAVVVAIAIAIVFGVLFAGRYRRRAAPVLLLASVGIGIVLIGGASLGRYSSIAPSKLVSTFGAERGGSITLIPDYAVKYPLGAGLGTAGPGVTANASINRGKLSGENSYVYLIVELGLPGLLVVMALLAASVRRATKLALSPFPPDTLSYLVALAAALYGCSLLTLAGPVTATPPLAPFVWLAMGVVTAWWASRTSRTIMGSSSRA